MPRMEIIRNVPESDLQELIADYKIIGAEPIISEKQSDGRFTVKATIPDRNKDSFITVITEHSK
jgi:hypothetical protein